MRILVKLELVLDTDNCKQSSIEAAFLTHIGDTDPTDLASGVRLVAVLEKDEG
jgi:hypothetical protein